MVERHLDIGHSLKTQEVFERVVQSRKGKEKAIGEVWLDGETPTRATTTSLTAPPFLFTYSLSTRTISLHTPTEVHRLKMEDGESFWDWFSECQVDLSAKSGLPGRGWRGGWVGWFGYEMKEESLQGYKRSRGDVEEEDVDACWAWANWILERTSEGGWIVRGLIDDTPRHPRPRTSDLRPESLVEWMSQLGVVPGLSSAEFDSLANTIEAELAPSSSGTNLVTPAEGFPSFTPVSNGEAYQSKIDLSRESIRQGDSYELTLTTAFQSNLPSTSDPYALYLRLRSFNPAYYSNYLSFPSLITPRGKGIHVLSSSPERFLKIEKERAGRVVEMMPIKGTKARVKPGQCVCGPNNGCQGKDVGSEECVEYGRKVDEQIGRELEQDLKERAENLMVSLRKTIQCCLFQIPTRSGRVFEC